jgi:hypothetical protein
VSIRTRALSSKDGKRRRISGSSGLLRETGIFAGLLVTEKNDGKDGEDQYAPELRLIYAPSGETSGHLTFPLRALATVAGRTMLGGLKLLLDSVRLFTDADDRRLPALLRKSRDAQAAVSTALAEQVLGALHELLRGLDAADPTLIRELARSRPEHLYEGLLTVLMRLVFILYAEDRDLCPHAWTVVRAKSTRRAIPRAACTRGSSRTPRSIQIRWTNGAAVGVGCSRYSG